MKRRNITGCCQCLPVPEWNAVMKSAHGSAAAHRQTFTYKLQTCTHIGALCTFAPFRILSIVSMQALAVVRQRASGEAHRPMKAICTRSVRLCLAMSTLYERADAHDMTSISIIRRCSMVLCCSARARARVVFVVFRL